MDSFTITIETPSRSTVLLLGPSAIWLPCMILYPERDVDYSTQYSGMIVPIILDITYKSKGN
jgi:hypothetical protein